MVAAGRGQGPGPITADGCAVDLYALLGVAGEPELVHRVAGPGASILELGAGAGRVTHPLLELGHEVVAVDSSADMLARIRGAGTVRADIETLDLGRRFDVVLLASNLLNAPEPATRAALLASARRHVADGGLVLVEWRPPGWFDTVRERTQETRGVRTTLHRLGRTGDLLDGRVSYRVGEREWRHDFTMARIGEQALRATLRDAGLAFRDWHSDDHDWFSATPYPPAAHA